MTPPRAPVEHGDCTGIARVMGLLGRAWAGPVLWAMLNGAQRYAAIRGAVPGVSDAVLPARLRELCEHGLVERVVDPGPPVRVRYLLTPAGRDTRRLLGELHRYAQRHPDVFTD